MHIVSKQGSERATSDSGKIITHEGRTHVTWQDIRREGYFNCVRTYDHVSGEWSAPVTLDRGIDNHARAVLAMTPDGIIHAVLGGHGTEVRWCCSEYPNDTSFWTPPQPIGVGTYPVLLGGADGTLYLTLRGQGEHRHERGVDLYRREPGGVWEKPLRIVKLAEEYGRDYAAYHMQMDVASDGVLHAIIDFYEGADESGRGIHQATCYTRSRDSGRSWERADNSPVRLPARPEDLDILSRNVRSRHEALPPPEIRQGGIVVDSCGRPFAFYLNHSVAPGHCVMVTLDSEGALQHMPVSAHWESLYPAMRAVDCNTSLRRDDTLFVLVTLVPYSGEWQEGKPTRAMRMCERRDERLVWLMSEDGGQTFRVQPFLEPGKSYNVPSVEQARGGNTVSEDRYPAVLYFDGSRGYPGGGDYYESGRSVPEILASGDFHTNNVLLKGLVPSDPYSSAVAWRQALPAALRDHPAFAWEDPAGGAPRVLLLGDSISISYTLGVRQRMGASFKVCRAPDNCRSTRQTIEDLEIWLGHVDWDLIHINCGIHDVTRMDAQHRARADGVPQVPLDTYRTNLEYIFDRLSRTGARIIWATTTPVGEEVGLRQNGDIDCYNRAADEVVRRRGIAINDLYAQVRSSSTPLWSDGVHFTDEGASLLADAVADALRAASEDG